MGKYKRVAVGGTFDKFHYGHRKLISKAFEIGESVEIGVTSNVFASKKGDVDSCDNRMANLNEFLKTKHNNYHISRLDDPYGPTINDENYDAIVVSEETEPNAIKINEIRVSKGMNPLDIVVISFVLANDGVPISSTRIRKGEINRKGQLID
ncbi:MAG: phosphopantetheine adenylyltransferase [archaeon]|nr:phosphopantetheine adenylyltransferase [archaeon]